MIEMLLVIPAKAGTHARRSSAEQFCVLQECRHGSRFRGNDEH